MPRTTVRTYVFNFRLSRAAGCRLLGQCHIQSVTCRVQSVECRSQAATATKSLYALLPLAGELYISTLFCFCFCFCNHFYFPAQLVGGFYPQRSSGQAVVTGVVPSPRYVPSFLSRTGFSIPTAGRFIECCSLTFALSADEFLCEKQSPRVCALGEN